MTRNITIVGLGEALFDLLPSGRALGGAPLNVACHAQRLLSGGTRHPHPNPLPRGEGIGVVASRVGSDGLGDEIVDALVKRGMTADCVQRDPSHPTGTVRVDIQDGQPSYDIVEGVAWDHFEFSPEWKQLAGECAAVCFGTLAQRSAESRRAIWRFLDATPQAVRLLDVNLRQAFYSRTVLEESCRRATLVKLNEDELPVLAELLELKADAVDNRLFELRAKYNLEAVIYTRGERGTLLVLESGPVDAPPVSYPAEPDADAVGAGDACSAGILVGWVRGMPPRQIAGLANHLGAFVASRHGATPDLPPEILEMVTL
jgi:fructokinase